MSTDRADLGVLTESERRVARLIGTGSSNKAAARELSLSIKTVEFHLGNVYRKLGIGSRTELANLVGSRASVLGTSTSWVDVGDLPPPPLRFLGRDADLAVVTDLVRANPLVTLTGVGGVGKTTLALAAANRVVSAFGDGVWWVDLAPLTRERAVAPVVASVLRVSEGLGDGAVATLTSALRRARLLIVLDNCEHVLESVRELCGELLRCCRGIAVLATSRHRLAVPGEREVAVRPLDVEGPDSPALRLMVGRIDGAGRTGDPLEMTAMEEICRRLDGVPLALELAAGRCRSMTAADVAARLDDRFRLLGGRDNSDRSTLIGTVQWSYDLLGPGAQAVLARLSVFAGAFSLQAAERIAAVNELDDDTVDDAVAELVELSLVDFDDGSYRLLETTRAFARDLLDASGEADPVLDAHLEWVVDLVTEARLELRGSDEADWARRLDRAWSDVRAAFDRALERDDPTAAILLATQLAWEAFYRRPEACTWIEEANRRFGATPHPHRHELVGAAAFAAWVVGEPARALQLGQLAMALDPAPGTAFDRLPEWATVSALGWAGDVQAGIDLALRTVETIDDDPFLLAVWLATVPIAYSFVGDLRSGVPASVRAIRMASELRNPSLTAFTSFGAAIARVESDPAAALDIIRRGAATARSVGNRWIEYTLTDMAMTVSLWLPERDPTGELQRCLDLIQTYARHGWTLHAWNSLSTLARLLVEQERHDEAAIVLHAFENSVASQADPVTVSYLAERLDTVLGTDELAKIRADVPHRDLDTIVQLVAAGSSRDHAR